MSNSKAPRIIAAGAIGNALEWYDFAIYGYFAATIGRVFFPHEDKVAQVLAAFGIFAVGFLMRPVGGALIGYIGDRFGRRTALTFSVAAMAIPTFLVGVLPGYQTLGVAAPILLTLLRMIQGLSVGGEYTTSIVFMVEHARPGRRHPGRVGDRRRTGRGDVGRGAGGLGLAHPVPDRPFGRPRGLRAAAGASTRTPSTKRPSARRFATHCATTARCCCGWPRCRSSTRSASI
jgi:MFS family permease